jgi:hypothetical protein
MGATNSKRQVVGKGMTMAQRRRLAAIRKAKMAESRLPMGMFRFSDIREGRDGVAYDAASGERLGVVVRHY